MHCPVNPHTYFKIQALGKAWAGGKGPNHAQGKVFALRGRARSGGRLSCHQSCQIAFCWSLRSQPRFLILHQPCRRAETTFPVAKAQWGRGSPPQQAAGEDKGEPRTILVPSHEHNPLPAPVPRHRYTDGDSSCLPRWASDSQFFVVGIIQSCPLVLLVRLPLYGLVVGIQVGAIQAVVILNQAWGEGRRPILES